jgi:hypothetical protein
LSFYTVAPLMCFMPNVHPKTLTIPLGLQTYS